MTDKSVKFIRVGREDLKTVQGTLQKKGGSCLVTSRYVSHFFRRYDKSGGGRFYNKGGNGRGNCKARSWLMTDLG